jgi:ABC-type polysaccharide/polyol phosphate export permease
MFNLNILYYLLKKEIKSLYVGSTIGMAWIILRPLLIIAVYWMVFSRIMKVRPYTGVTEVPYIIFMLSTIFFWFAFQESVLKASTSVIDRGEVIKKVHLSLEVFPVSSVLVSYFHHVIGVLIFFLMSAFLSGPSILWLFVIPTVVLQILFSLGAGLFISALSVYVRDVPQMVNIVLQGLFFLTPVVYPIENIPESLRYLFYLNPLTYFIKIYHSILIYRVLPDYSDFFIVSLLSVISLFTGFKIFNRLKEGFADAL